MTSSRISSDRISGDGNSRGEHSSDKKATGGKFSGFQKSTLYTPVPNALFGPLLEQIQDLAELKVTLRGLWLLHRQRNQPHLVHLGEFLGDTALLRGLKGTGDAKQEIRRGLELAVARGTFLLHRTDGEKGDEAVYLLNTDSGRAALARMRQDPNTSQTRAGTDALAPDELYVQRSDELPDEKPGIFALYEDNVGVLSPLISQELMEAEDRYPQAWIFQAFKIAVSENKRSWRYIAGILRRWAAEGKDDGKPGRNPEKDNRQKYLEDYERRWSRSPR